MSLDDVLGRDLKIVDHEIGGKDIIDVQTVRGKQDLATVTGLDNLVQALRLRLNAKKGDLRELGHPDYGSRLHSLIGRLNTASNRRLLEAYTRECLGQEPRIKEIINIGVESRKSEPGCVWVHASVEPVNSHEPLHIGFPFRFEG